MQRLTIRLVIAIFTFMLGVTATLVWFTFRPSANEPKPSITPIPVSPLAYASPETKILSITEPVEFFGWWCCGGNQLCECDSPDVPKTAYIKLEEWISGVSGDSPEPDYIDIIYHLKNKESQKKTLVVSAVGDFKWAKPELGVYDGSEKDPEELLVQVTWKDKRSIGQQIIRGVAPGEIRDVKFEKFNLRAVTNKYLSKDSTRLDLWPWKFRVSITVKTLEGKSVDKKQGILNVIPGD